MSDVGCDQPDPEYRRRLVWYSHDLHQPSNEDGLVDCIWIDVAEDFRMLEVRNWQRNHLRGAQGLW